MVPGKNGFNTFAKTTTEIRQYIARTVPGAGEFVLVMRPGNLSFPTIPEPVSPEDQNNLIEFEKWKAADKLYRDLMEKQEENKRQANAIVWGQCSPTVQDQPVPPMQQSIMTLTSLSSLDSSERPCILVPPPRTADTP
jgi:hypothetical protein